ncbi:RNA polymerase sigma factor [Bacillus salitolerans]|uniref:RNA polymerase sigma factor n=1 Tax=Bacillus salitolerans TaxID=1437434 RepID=A0ABW4LPP4_9BACI
MSTDEQLVKKILTGQTECFREIVSRYEKKVWAIAYKVSKSEKDAEDIAQDVFLQVYKSIHVFREESSFSTWIYRIAMNKALDWKRRYERKAAYDVNGEFGHTADKIQLLPEQKLLKQLEQEELLSIMNKLPDKYCHVIKLYYFNEYSYQEISNELGIAVKTVETRLYRAKGLMRKYFGKEEELR